MMTSDILQEELVTLTKASKEWPGGPQSLSSIRRQAFTGLARGDEKIKLEVVKIGGRIYTSRQAVKRFAERLTENRIGSNERGQPKASARRPIEETRSPTTIRGRVMRTL